LEAQAMDVPVVATSVGGIIEIIDHEQTGLLVPPKDENALAGAILRLLKDRPLAQRIIVAAKKKLLDHYTLDHMASRTVKVYEEILKMTNILVIKLSSLGDVVLITAALKAIRQKFPEAKIYCLTGKEGKHVLQNCPYLDGVILFDANDRHRGWFGLIKLTRKLRKYRFDKVIDLQNNRKSHLLSYLSFPKESYGYRNAKWGSLLSEGIDDSQQPMAAVPHQFQILNQLGILMPEHPLLELWPSDKEKGYVQELLAAEWLADSKQIVGINIAASAKWQTKNWPLEHMARLCDLLASKGIRVFITGMDKDRALGQQLQTLTKSKPALFIGKTNILQLAALIKTCNVFITPDSAPLHVAAAMHVPTIALFGPTSSVRHVPPAETMVIHEKKLKCTPCYSPRCRIMTHACMQDIRPEEILRSIEQIMGGRES
jgi:lipopolysaccharide heptosyltransferase II